MANDDWRDVTAIQFDLEPQFRRRNGPSKHCQNSKTHANYPWLNLLHRSDPTRTHTTGQPLVDPLPQSPPTLRHQQLSYPSKLLTAHMAAHVRLELWGARRGPPTWCLAGSGKI